MLETNKHSRSVLQHCLGEVTTDEKGVFVQIQITISWKALVLTYCLNTLVHDCSLWVNRWIAA